MGSPKKKKQKEPFWILKRILNFFKKNYKLIFIVTFVVILCELLLSLL